MIIYYVYFHPTGINIDFLNSHNFNFINKANNDTNANLNGLVDPVQEVHPVTTTSGSDNAGEDLEQNSANPGPTTAIELRPMSRLSSSTPVLDETDSKGKEDKNNQPRELVRRTVSAPSPEEDEVVVDFSARRSWKGMAR